MNLSPEVLAFVQSAVRLPEARVLAQLLAILEEFRHDCTMGL